MSVSCLGGWCRDRNACALYHAADRRWPVERLCGDTPQPVRIVNTENESMPRGGQNTRRAEALDHFAQAGAAGLDTHELGALMRLTHGAAKYHIEAMRKAGDLIRAEAPQGPRPARYWLAQYVEQAKAHRYPYVAAPKIAQAKSSQGLGKVTQACVDLIVAAGAHGINTVQIAERIGSKRESVLNRLQSPKQRGMIFSRWSGSKTTPATWYAAGVVPTERPIPKSRTTTIREANKGLDPNAPAIVPKGLKVTRGPDFEPDKRWKSANAPSVVNSAEARPWALSVAR